jgi:hypothetical protein
MAHNNDQHLEATWGPAIQSTHTISLTATGMEKINPLDARNTKEIKFRILCTEKKLPTLDTMYKWKISNTPICPRCGDATETHEHLWKCADTGNKMEKLRQTLKAGIETQKEHSTDWEWIPQDHSKRVPSTTLLEIIGINDPEFLHTPTAQGIITQELTQKFANSPQIKNNKMGWLLYTMNCWMSALYHNIWLERCKSLKQPKMPTKITINIPIQALRKQTRNIITIPLQTWHKTTMAPKRKRIEEDTQRPYKRHKPPNRQTLKIRLKLDANTNPANKDNTQIDNGTPPKPQKRKPPDKTTGASPNKQQRVE